MWIYECSGKKYWPYVIHHHFLAETAPAQLLLGRTVRDFLPRLLNFIKEEFLTPETRQGILHDKSTKKLNLTNKAYQSSYSTPAKITRGNSLRNWHYWSPFKTIPYLRPHRTFMVHTDQVSVLI